MISLRDVRAGGIAFAILLGACGRPRTVVIEIKQFAYVPARAQVRPGDTLVFINHDIVPHTATAKDHGWDSGTIAPEGQKRVVVKGVGDYTCTFHPTMAGTLY